MHEFRNVLLLSPARAAKPVNNIRRRRQILSHEKTYDIGWIFSAKICVKYINIEKYLFIFLLQYSIRNSINPNLQWAFLGL